MFITINRPKALNALNSQTVNELGEVISSVEKERYKSCYYYRFWRKIICCKDIAEMHNLNAMEEESLL